MTLDWIDRAFVARAPKAVVVPAGAPVAVAPAVARDAEPVGQVGDGHERIVERLLAAVPSQWDALADAVDAVARNGRRVVAVTGARRGEGRSTVVAGVAAALRARGRNVATVARPPLLLTGDEAREARAADVVLVDAGAWFGSGPVRRGAVERAALGCDGVLLVRREDAPPCPARERVIESLGLALVGEAVTFAAAAA